MRKKHDLDRKKSLALAAQTVRALATTELVTIAGGRANTAWITCTC